LYDFPRKTYKLSISWSPCNIPFLIARNRLELRSLLEKQKHYWLILFLFFILEIKSIAYNRWSCLSDANVPSARWFSLLPLRRLEKHTHTISHRSIKHSYSSIVTIIILLSHFYYINIFNYIDCLSLDGCRQRTTKRQVTLFVHFN
jgi:hypothetical protein